MPYTMDESSVIAGAWPSQVFLSIPKCTSITIVRFIKCIEVDRRRNEVKT
jgi:hypothetical protein